MPNVKEKSLMYRNVMLVTNGHSLMPTVNQTMMWLSNAVSNLFWFCLCHCFILFCHFKCCCRQLYVRLRLCLMPFTTRVVYRLSVDLKQFAKKGRVHNNDLQYTLLSPGEYKKRLFKYISKDLN